MASQATSSRMTLFSHPHCCLKHPCCPQVARNCIVLPAWVKCSTACWSSSMVAVYTNLHPPMTPHPPNPIVACHSEAPVVKVATDFTDLQAMNGLHGTIVNGQLQFWKGLSISHDGLSERCNCKDEMLQGPQKGRIKTARHLAKTCCINGTFCARKYTIGTDIQFWARLPLCIVINLDTAKQMYLRH